MEAIEIRLQRAIEDYLCERGLFPWQVLYCQSPLFLKITFMLSAQRSEFLDFIEYPSLADKSGIQICQDELTILLRGLTLRWFLNKIGNDGGAS